MTELKDPFAGVRELMSRLEQIIALIPLDFPAREDFISALNSRLESTKFTAPTAVGTRALEVANILAYHLPEGTNPELEEKIGNIMCVELP
jgi:hypothetical protein